MTAQINTANAAQLTQTNGTSGVVPSTTPPSGPAMPPELEQTLSILSSHKSVLGYMILSRGHPIRIIRHSGVVFDGEQGRRYASAVGRIVHSAEAGLEEIRGQDGDSDNVKFMRIRTSRHEIMISPEHGYLLAVLRNPDM